MRAIYGPHATTRSVLMGNVAATPSARSFLRASSQFPPLSSTYDGYWVTFVDPWPEAWSPTWYDTDDVYVDYTGDGYYMYNRMHPGVGIAVTIAF